ncbi:MAG: hypothetical protein KBE47_00420, partial [Gemmiger sp.]|nr:hypothetical protein [Gemmiger sp.]
FAVSATGGAHLCSIQYYLRFWLSICRTSLAVSALRIMRYCPKTISPADAEVILRLQGIFVLKIFLGNTAQFPPYGLSTAPAAAARHLRCQNAR